MDSATLSMATDQSAVGSRGRWNFSLRWLLVSVAFVSLVLGVGRQWWLVDRARYDEMRVRASWYANRVLMDDLIAALDRLYHAESSAMWIGRREATTRHVQRLRDLADTIEVRIRTTLGGNMDKKKKKAEELRAEADRLEEQNKWPGP